MTVLTTRPCKLGTTQNRPERHGDETKPALSIPFAGILLEKDEVDELVGEGYWDSLFLVREGHAHARAYPKVKAHELDGKYSGSVAIMLGARQPVIERDGVTLAKITLAPLEGGLVAMSCDVQTNEEPSKIVGKLLDRIDTEISVEMEIGDKAERAARKQGSLALNAPGTPDTGSAAGEETGEDQDDVGRSAPSSEESIGRAQADALAASTPATDNVHPIAGGRKDRH